ncbi:sialic acid-binding Ig-like lectin 13 [Pangasianodon hypophthalmus]|uniref:sialic acid-binding Ig-like lectin 13 n=1 Tax=Pangasianodon hypophthalmus TaxID=310915 RepID=UPI0023082B9A|nr:sialic acid-binding Ig-like lectin 13 [Pangasianodon hypophthalmus]
MKSAEKLIIIVCFLFQGVLCREFSISLPQSVEALRGLCVLIPCSFEIKEEYDADLQTALTGIWTKDGDDHKKNKVFNSKVTKENKIEGEIIGDLHMKNCTTIFYNISERDSGRYYFRLETSGKLKITYTSSVDIRVQVSPISPSITLYKEDQGKVEDQNEVVEGTSVSLICSAPAPCPSNLPTFTWNFLPEERRQEQNYSTNFSSSQLNFKATHLHHGVDFTCTATYQLQNKTKSAQRSFTLHVLYAPQVSPSSSCNTTQDLILCSCEVHGNPSPKLEWRLSVQTVLPSEATPIQVESVGNTSLRRSSAFSIPQSVKDTPTLQCVGSNNLGHASQVFFITKAQRPAEEHTAVLYLVLSLSVVLLLCVGVIGFLVYKLKQLSRKIKVLQTGDTYASLQLSAVQNSDYETLQTNRGRREKKDNS